MAALVFPEALQVEIETDLAAKRAEFPVRVARGDEVKTLADRLRDPGTARRSGAGEEHVRYVNGDLLENGVATCSLSHGATVPYSMP